LYNFYISRDQLADILLQGYHAAKEIAKNATVDEVLQYHIGCNEFLHRYIDKDCSKKAGKVINRETVIFDCTGMGWYRTLLCKLFDPMTQG
jgi:hypothetical protein